jgi:nucleoid-associated protein YgaU
LEKPDESPLAANSKMSALEQRALAAEAKVKAFEAVKGRELQEAAALEAAKAQIIATHTLTADETLSHLSLKYYGHATEPYWRIIYEANKDVIGANPNKVRPGLEIKIPVLPEDMKK